MTIAGGPLRVAWLGPTPTDGNGSAFAGTQMVLALADLGVHVECFVLGGVDAVSRRLMDHPGVSVTAVATRWSWGRWYSRHPMFALLSGLLARAHGQWRVVRAIRRRHAQQPFDVVYQYAQIELLALRWRAAELPPLVLHPGTHAAGELRWLWRERRLARRCGESRAKRLLVTLMLAARSVLQRADVRRANLTVAISRVFAEHLVHDYGVPLRQLRVVPHVVDLERFRPAPPEHTWQMPLRVVFSSSMSVRKGVELVVELSHRLADLAGHIHIEAVGDHRQWSNYQSLLDELHPVVGHRTPALSSVEMADSFRAASIVLQPSRYEPFALTVAEALASGVPVVASDEVGATEEVSRDCCRLFASGDIDGLEREVRTLIKDMTGPRATIIRTTARAEAERVFAAQNVAPRFLQALELAAGRIHTDCRSAESQ